MNKDFDKALTFDGWLTINEAMTLFNLAKESKYVIVEIGAWKGKSGGCMCAGSSEGNKYMVYSIDTFKGSPEHADLLKYPHGQMIKEFDENISSLSKEANCLSQTLIGYSMDYVEHFPDESIGLLFIDGNHSVLEVMKDFSMWFSKVRTDGTIAIHDATTWQGPNELCKMLESFFGEFYYIDSLFVGKRGSFKDRGSLA
jgi:hypothetical protein